jgi:hypothetical protein
MTSPRPAPRRLALVITGDRNATTYGDVMWMWRGLMESHLLPLFRRYDWIVLIHGACGEDATKGGEMKGIDRIAHDLGTLYSKAIATVPVPANWKDGTRAGPLRNNQMLGIQAELGLQGYAKLTYGYHDDLPNSRGTGGCVRESRRRDVETHAFRIDGTAWSF